MKLHTIYSAGYLGHSASELAPLLESLGGAILADIRFLPASRRREWCRDRLLENVRYVWLWELGNRNYKEKGGEIVLAKSEAGVQRVLDLAEICPVVMLCVCKGYAGCHRKVVAELFRAERGIEVVEIADWGDALKLGGSYETKKAGCAEDVRVQAALLQPQAG